MNKIQDRIKKGACILLSAAMLGGCAVPYDSISETAEEKETAPVTVTYEADPATFSLNLVKGDRKAAASLAGDTRNVADYETSEGKTAWRYPDENVAVSLEPEEDYLRVTIRSEAEVDNSFMWPNISGSSYYMPFGEGKRVPAQDPVWADYLSGQEFSVTEQLSMPFWAVESGECALLYILEDPIRSDMIFSGTDSQTENKITFALRQQFPEIDQEKEVSFRIYMTENNPVAAAKIYKNYVAEQGKFVTLEQKAQKNENIRKLYGAPHIYLWGDNLIAPEDINWPVFRASLESSLMDRLKAMAPETESGAEALTALAEMQKQDYVADYQKNVMCRYLSELLQMPDFYNSQDFPVKDEKMNQYSSQGIQNLSEPDQIQFNKWSLAANMPGAFKPADTWMDSNTVDIVEGLKEAGIDRAFIGLNSWEQAYAKPKLVEQAVGDGYLIGPYDSYHSIHKPGEEKWITADFEDEALYENGTVLNKDGEKESGFQNVGRKLNPTVSMPSVIQRTGKIMDSGIGFNSWFIDCDATGEIYDDYTPGRMTTRQQDLNARLERMAYIRDEHGMVIGSEGGHDFAAADIAFAHGIELKSFSWMDEDMKKNKESEYFIGAYYNPTGGVAAHFAKQIPVKDKYDTLFVDPAYDLPLFKLVYNDSVITTYHWDWSTFKIKDSVQNRMVRELLYNVPPLYHLDAEEWGKYKTAITEHTGVWSEFSKKAVLREMTNFVSLEKDGSVQMTEFGDELWVAANFGDKAFIHEGTEIPPHSALIHMDGQSEVYTPSAIS